MGESSRDYVTLPQTRISLIPKAVAVVTSLHEGELGVATIAWTGVVSSRPPVIAVSFLPDSYCRGRIEGSREFVAHMPGVEMLPQVERFGAQTGPLRTKVEDLVDPEVVLLDSVEIQTPRLAGYFLAAECRVLRKEQVGLYDAYFGEVLAMHVRKDVYRDDHARGNIAYESASPVLCFGDQYWSNDGAISATRENKDHPHGARH